MLIKFYGHSDDCFEVEVYSKSKLEDINKDFLACPTKSDRGYETYDMSIDVIQGEFPSKSHNVKCPDCDTHFTYIERDDATYQSILRLTVTANYDKMWTFGYFPSLPAGWRARYGNEDEYGMILWIDTGEQCTIHNITFVDSHGPMK